MPTVSRRVMRRILGMHLGEPASTEHVVDRIEHDKERIHHWREDTLGKLGKWDGAKTKIDLLERKLDLIKSEASHGLSVDEANILEHDLSVLEHQLSELEHTGTLSDLKGVAPPPGIETHADVETILSRMDAVINEMDDTLKTWDHLTRTDIIAQVKKASSKEEMVKNMASKKYEMLKSNLIGLLKSGKLGPLQQLNDEKLFRVLPGFYVGMAKFLNIPEDKVRLPPDMEKKLILEILQIAQNAVRAASAQQQAPRQ